MGTMGTMKYLQRTMRFNPSFKVGPPKFIRSAIGSRLAFK